MYMQECGAPLSFCIFALQPELWFTTMLSAIISVLKQILI